MAGMTSLLNMIRPSYSATKSKIGPKTLLTFPKKILSARLFHCRNLYMHHHINTICRTVVMRLLRTSGNVVVSWGTHGEHVASSAYTALIADALIDAIDAMMCNGFAPWTVGKYRLPNGRTVRYPNVVDATTGNCFVYTRKDGNVEVTFETALATDVPTQKNFPVYVFAIHRPTWDGALRSPMAGVIMHASYVTQCQNTDTMAVKFRARPPLVYEDPVDPMLQAPILSERLAGLAPGVLPPSAIDPYSTHPGPVDLPTDPTSKVQTLKYWEELNDNIRDLKIAHYGFKLTADGSMQYVPDPLAGTYPLPGTERGCFNENEHHAPKAKRVATQPIPQRDEKLHDLLDDMNRSLLAIWGVPTSFANIKSRSYKDDLDWMGRQLYNTVQQLADLACEAVESMLNAMFTVEETRELMTRYVIRRIAGSPPESDEMRKVLRETGNPSRYHVAVQLRRILGPQELLTLKALDVPPEQLAVLVREYHSMHTDSAGISVIESAATAKDGDEPTPKKRKLGWRVV